MKKDGFTLVELMIVVSILGILAAIVLPEFQNHATESRDTAIKSSLHTVRCQIELYKMQHNGMTPGYWSTIKISGDSLVYQFTGTTKLNGMSSSSKTPTGDYLYGPYLVQMPENPFNSLNDITVVADGTTNFTADDSSGWLYERTTGTFKVNKSGTDSDGIAYVDY